MHCLAPDSDGDGTGCDNMTCIITTFNPLRKVEIKVNQQMLNEMSIDKANLKRTLIDSNNGTAGDDADVDVKTNGVNVNMKKLKSEENWYSYILFYVDKCVDKKGLCKKRNKLTLNPLKALFERLFLSLWDFVTIFVILFF